MDHAPLIEAAKQVPALLVLVFLVLRFQKVMEGDRVFRKQMMDECHEIKKQAIIMLEKCAEALGSFKAKQ